MPGNIPIPVIIPNKEFNTSEKVALLNYSATNNRIADCYAAMKLIEESEIEPESEFNLLKKFITILYIFVDKTILDHEKLLIRIALQAEKCAIKLVSENLE